VTPSEWQRINHVVAAALDLPADRRVAHVREACRDDEELQAQCLRLIGHAIPETVSLQLSPLGSGVTIAGRYVIERELGRGGFAVAYLARDTQLHSRRVVVKVMSQGAFDDWFEQKFKQELRAVATIDDPSVVAPLDTGRLPDGTPYIVMQFVEGSTLRALMQEGRLPLGRAADIICQTGRALGAVHKHNVYHRDVKPANIMVQPLAGGGDHVRLIDFGIASLAEATDRSTVQTRVVGSLLYMAPEQLVGRANSRTDVYALGVVAYELVTGVPPFAATNVLELAGMQRAGVGVPPSRLCPSISPEAERLILEPLALDPAKRPADIAAWARQLATALNQPQISSRQPYKVTRSVRVAATLLIGAVLAGGAMWWRMMSNTADISSAMVQPAEQRISLTLMVDGDSGAEPSRVATNPVVLRSTDTFRLHITAEQAGHLYLYSEDSKRESLNALFPSLTANGGSSFLPAGRTLVTRALAPDPEPGSAQLWIVWGTRASALLEESRHWATPQYAGEIRDARQRASIRELLKTQARHLRSEGDQLILSGQGDLLAGSIDISHR
jgi:serine/threonine-protein kinase